MPHDSITDEQFDAIAQLIRMQRDQPSAQAARLVLVEGMTGAEAARRLGVTPQTVSGAVVRVQRAMALARIAAGSE